MVQGSPPHARGKVKVKPVWSDVHGITPARAGKSQQTYQSLMRGKDHPRTRGEKPAF